MQNQPCRHGTGGLLFLSFDLQFSSIPVKPLTRWKKFNNMKQPTLQDRLDNALTSEEEALRQLERSGVELSPLAKKKLEELNREATRKLFTATPEELGEAAIKQTNT